MERRARILPRSFQLIFLLSPGRFTLATNVRGLARQIIKKEFGGAKELSPQGPHPSLRATLSRSRGRGNTFMGRLPRALPWAIVCRTYRPFPDLGWQFWFNLSAKHCLNCCHENREGNQARRHYPSATVVPPLGRVLVPHERCRVARGGMDRLVESFGGVESAGARGFCGRGATAVCVIGDESLLRAELPLPHAIEALSRTWRLISQDDLFARACAQWHHRPRIAAQ
jgi:hypothetical protein